MLISLSNSFLTGMRISRDPYRREEKMSKLKIMVLDDEPIVCKRLKPALEKQGYEVDTFTQSSDAMERIKDINYDIIITDLKMKGVDGMQLLTEAKQRSPKTEVIVITGFATMETAKESFHKGVFDFIAKPFKLSEIQDVVTRAEAKIRGE
jgi:DNA-binding NtrC family response regulator